ncbi:hypothetical protein R5W23_005049 [Gemmata sp. JC673]|uniref:VWA domain-containing protein n=1 Tax=Gemmata algarum TaxID=2975278 RepID=A0ABU5ESX3_9BACT|nr:hypothetical protein [Gemmata algarum]MDY3558354.1 hypothetical protein [Gemmata algarum]
MNETATTRKTEYVFRRLVDSFDQFGQDLLSALALNAFSLALIGALALVVLARVGYRLASPGRPLKTGVSDASAFGVVWGVVGSLAVFAVLVESLVLLAAARGGDTDMPLWRLLVSVAVVPLGALTALAALFAVFKILFPRRTAASPPRDLPAVALALLTGLLVGTLVVWWVVSYFGVDAQQAKGEADSLATTGDLNKVKWLVLVAFVFGAGALFTLFTYILDMRTAPWFVAVPLALVRTSVYGALCVLFLLPAEQTWEETNKQSRVVILLDITPSVTAVSDEAGATAKKRIDVLIEFLTDEKVAFLKNLLDKNPVAVYAFGTRLDEAPALIPRGAPVWSKGEWDSFRRYDFKPFVLKGLSDAGQAQLRQSSKWGDGPGTADWAQEWFARRGDGELKAFTSLESDADVEALRKNLDKLDKRIDVARTITLGTNVPDAVTAAVTREASNMVQGIVVLSDGRSNLGSESSYAELRDRAGKEKIPVFTVVVGEDRERVAISVTDIQAPDAAPIDEAWKFIVEADGQNLANKEVEVLLDLYAPGNTPVPGRDVKDLTPNETFRQKLVFAPGDPPHGQVEFVIDPAKLPEKLTEPSKDAAIPKPVLKEGKWAARARIARDPQEAFPDPEHFSTVREVSVLRQKLKILLVAGAPSREFTFLRTLLAREVQEQRATLTTFVQNEAGTTGKLTAEQDEVVIRRFPTHFDLRSNKGVDPADRPYNMNEYDVMIAFDPDWSELSAQQAEDLSRWVREGGGGLIFVAGPINTFQLARVEENSKHDPLLKILPVQPADIIAQRIKPIPKSPRRLYLNPKAIIGSDLLRLDDRVQDDPIAGWERFFTDRDRHVKDPDDRVELYPTRGFFSCYPLKPDVGIGGVKAGSAVLAEFADVGDNNEVVKLPYVVTNNPSAAYRTCYIGSGEFHKMRSYEPGEGTGREFFERVWIKMIKYMGGKRNVKAPRGRLLVGKEAVAGAPLRVQARVLNESAKPYEVTAPPPKFLVVQEPKQGDKRTFGPFDMAAKPNPGGGFDGYYAGQVLLDPKQFAADDSNYRVEIEIPDSAGDKLTGEFKIRAADPEMDNKRPDFGAMVRMASEFDKDFQARLTDKVKSELGTKLPKEGNVPRLAFKATDHELLKLIPECMKTETRNTEVRGPVNDLWDKPLRFSVGGLEVRLLDFDLTAERLAVGLNIALVAALVLMVARGVWASVYERIGRTPWLVVMIAVMAVEVVALVGLGVMVGVGELDWWYFMVAVGVFLTQVLAFRADWGSGLLILGAALLAAVAVKVVAHRTQFSGDNVQISFALLAVVSLLSLEWLTRKVSRLA